MITAAGVNGTFCIKEFQTVKTPSLIRPSSLISICGSIILEISEREHSEAFGWDILTNPLCINCTVTVLISIDSEKVCFAPFLTPTNSIDWVENAKVLWPIFGLEYNALHIRNEGEHVLWRLNREFYLSYWALTVGEFRLRIVPANIAKFFNFNTKTFWEGGWFGSIFTYIAGEGEGNWLNLRLRSHKWGLTQAASGVPVMGLWANSHSASRLSPWPWAGAEFVVFTVDVIPAHITIFNMLLTSWVVIWVGTFHSKISTVVFKCDPLLIVDSELILKSANVGFGVPHLLLRPLTAREI